MTDQLQASADRRAAAARKTHPDMIMDGDGPSTSAFDTARRKARKPFGQHVQKLAFEPEPGFRHYWFIDDGRGRIDRAKEAGYEHVTDKEGQPVRQPTGVTDVGTPQISYLMKIPQEWFEEDMAAQQRRIDEIDDSIRRGEDAEGKPGIDGRYVPSRGIKMWRK